ncbi:MAG: hypothetical protein JWN02_2569, partial [Acidobacteria bacterium]|nr:hypothetical protein [Acidobacteriota bacterium]
MTSTDRRWAQHLGALCIILVAPLLLGVEPPLRIEGVSPRSAPVGGKVTLLLSRPVDKATVRFGGHAAKIESAGARILYVVVPQGLTAYEHPPILLRTSAGEAANLVFEVAADNAEAAKPATAAGPPLSILSVTPSAAAGGETVSLRLSRPLRSGAASVYFGDVRAPSTPSKNSITVETMVPSTVEAGEGAIAVVESGVKTDPIPFTVLRQTILGFSLQTFPWVLVTGSLILAMATAAYLIRRSRARYQRIESQYELVRMFKDGDDGEEEASAAPAEKEPPKVPRELVEICASRNALLFAGPGLCAQSRLPTRYEAILYLIKQAALDEILKKQLIEALRRGQMGFVTEILDSRIDRDALIAELQTLYADDDVQLSPAHRQL